MNSEFQGEGVPFEAGGGSGNPDLDSAPCAGEGVEERFRLWHRRHVERFIRFLKPRRLKMAEPSDVAEFLVRRFPEVLAVQGNVPASTQNQALQVLVFKPW